MTTRPHDSKARSWVTLVLVIAILIPSLYGFGSKFIEFVMTFREARDGAFAVTPIVNYLLASIGFFLLLLWATMNGMFRDIEAPKHDLLKREQELDDIINPHGNGS